MRKTVIFILSLIVFLTLTGTANAANIVRINGRTFTSNSNLQISRVSRITVTNSTVTRTCTLVVNGQVLNCN